MVKISALDKKTWRDLRHFRGQALAVIGVMLAGIAAFFTFYSAFLNLDLTRRAYYKRYRFADLEVLMERAPRVDAINRLSDIEGVMRVEARIVKDVNLDLDGVEEPQFGRIISFPEMHQNRINDIYIAQGQYFSGERKNEVIINERFFKENNLSIGDTIQAVINYRKQSLKIVGTALSPEFVYAIPGATEFMPDDKHFAILWVTTDFAEMAFDMEGACNNLVAAVNNRADIDVIVEKAKTVLETYGVYHATKQADQLSNYYLSNEIRSLKTSAFIVAFLFLGIAAMILLIMMRRMVKQQRTQIGVLKAFGYSNSAVLLHYWKFVLVISLTGCTVGLIVGYILGFKMMNLYQDFFQFPMLEYRFYPATVFVAYILSIVFSVGGATVAVLETVKIPPAVAIQPEVPTATHKTPLERFRKVWRRLSFTWKMASRNMFRYPARSLFTVFGVLISTGILIMGYCFSDSAMFLINFQFDRVQRQDMTVSLVDEFASAAYYEAMRFPHTIYVEPMFQYGFELRAGSRKKDISITGVPDNLKLHQLIDNQGRSIKPPVSGLLINEYLGEILRIKAGDTVYIKPLSGKIKEIFPVKIAGTVEQYLGLNVYADIRFLTDLLNEEFLVNSLLLRVEKGKEIELSRWLKDVPAVISASISSDTYDNYYDYMVSAMNIMNVFLILLAGLIAFAIIYNSSSISIMERTRELATLRVMGFSVDEVGNIVFYENYVLSILGLLLGYPAGIGISYLLLRAYDSDIYRMPLSIEDKTYILTTIYIVVFVIVANWISRRRLKRLDLIAVLKSRE